MAAEEYSANRTAVGVSQALAVEVRRRVRTVRAVIGSANRKYTPANMPEQQNHASSESPSTHSIVMGMGSSDSNTIQTTQPVTERLAICVPSET